MVNITRPARALKDLPVSVSDKVPPVSGLAVQRPVRVYLDVGIVYSDHLGDKNNVHKLNLQRDNRNLRQGRPETHLPVLLAEVALQLSWLREKGGVPGEIPLVVRVFDIQPEHVVRNIVAVKSGVHVLHVRFVDVVPATLVVPECKQRRKGLKSWKRASWRHWGKNMLNISVSYYYVIHTGELSILGEELLWTGPQ